MLAIAIFICPLARAGNEIARRLEGHVAYLTSTSAHQLIADLADGYRD